MSRMSDRLARHQRRIERTAGEDVIYRRGSQSVNLVAAVGNTPFEIVEEDGVATAVRMRDYLVRTSALVLGGVQIEPSSGDEIHHTIEGRLHVYQVAAPGQAPVFRASGPNHERLRIHTQLIRTE